jgi:hypothetical protein
MVYGEQSFPPNRLDKVALFNLSPSGMGILQTSELGFCGEKTSIDVTESVQKHISAIILDFSVTLDGQVTDHNRNDSSRSGICACVPSMTRSARLYFVETSEDCRGLATYLGEFEDLLEVECHSRVS